ncbi:MAG: hypothetical protein NDI69_02135 [Bacteriovoracaceae bacterium]|nr:hypothetical protein [Bacteriovoracaceae bacterium]
MKFFLFIILFSSNLQAEALHPKTPSGWIEMNSLAPVVLTWAYADPKKDLMEVPSLMVQKFSLQEKLLKFIQQVRPDGHGCRHVPAIKKSDWSQSWCPRKESIMVLLWKGPDSLVKAPQETLLNWVLTHE